MNKRLLIIILAFDLIFAFLPIYDSFNISGWIGQGLSFQRSLPAFQGSLNPAAFFISIIIFPVSLSYSLIQSIYVSALILKVILLIFFYATAYLIYGILQFYSIESRTRNFIMILILLNPGIIFVIFIWAELEVIPAFFVTLSFYLFVIQPFQKKITNSLLSVVSLLVSVFFFLYPLILIPTYVIYSKSRRERIIYLALFLLLGIVLEGIQIKLFQGYFYDYLGSLSGSVASLAPSGLPTGFFDYIHLYGADRLYSELSMIAILSIAVPLYLHHLKYESQVTLYIISAIFIFISPTINMDNFLFIVPFVFLASASIAGLAMSRLKILWLTSLLFIPDVFAPLFYSYQNVFGIFYWLYPLTHFDGPGINPTLMNQVIIPAYNLCFILLLYISVSIPLVSWKTETARVKQPSDKHLYMLTKSYSFKTKKLVSILIVVILLSIPFSLIYNISDNSLSVNHPSNFPLLYFYPESYENSNIFLPVGSSSYQVDGATLTVPSSTPFMLLQRNLNNQSFALNATLTLSRDLNSTLAFSNLWSVQDMSVFNSSNLTEISPSNVINVSSVHNERIPLLSSSTKVVQYFNGSAVHYTIDTSYLQNHSLLWFFNPAYIPHSQSDPFYVTTGNMIIELVLYPTYALIANYTESQGWQQSSPIPLVKLLDQYGWYDVTMGMQNGKLHMTFGGETYSALIPASERNLNITLGSPFGASMNPFFGNGTCLYSYSNSTLQYIPQISINYNGYSHIINNPNVLKIQMLFSNTQSGSILKINNKSLSMRSSSFIILGKDGGTGVLKIEVNEMKIAYSHVYGYYLIPVFFAFYMPLVFAVSVLLFIRKSILH